MLTLQPGKAYAAAAREEDKEIVDVQCDYTKQELGNMRTGEAEMSALEATMRTIGEKIGPECLAENCACRKI